jgi:hypothetical protein
MPLNIVLCIFEIVKYYFYSNLCFVFFVWILIDVKHEVIP